MSEMHDDCFQRLAMAVRDFPYGQPVKKELFEGRTWVGRQLIEGSAVCWQIR